MCQCVTARRRTVEAAKLARQRIRKVVIHYPNSQRPDGSETQTFCNIIGKWIGSYDVTARISCKDDEDDEGYKDEEGYLFEGLTRGRRDEG